MLALLTAFALLLPLSADRFRVREAGSAVLQAHVFATDDPAPLLLGARSADPEVKSRCERAGRAYRNVEIPAEVGIADFPDGPLRPTVWHNYELESSDKPAVYVRLLFESGANRREVEREIAQALPHARVAAAVKTVAQWQSTARRAARFLVPFVPDGWRPLPAAEGFGP
jgi:hypothetical protein